MILSKASVTMNSSHALSQEHTRQATGQIWFGKAPPAAKATRSTDPEGGAGNDRVTISNPARTRLIQLQPESPGVNVATSPDEVGNLDPKMQSMRRLLELLTGKKIALPEFEASSPGPLPTMQTTSAAGPPAVNQPQAAGWGVRLDLQESRSEHEELAFNASGSITTGEGEQINFTTQLKLARDFSLTSTHQVRAGDAVLTDPLVVNFDGQGPALSAQPFAFDLNSDGSLEQIAFLQSGSGFLALDRNQDGQINNGEELFGPKSGSGFAELAQYDSDHNGWLDAQDPIMAKLQIWSKDEVGVDQLTSLQEKGIGAILLNAVDSPFSLKDGNNQLLGQIQKTGVFFKENGEAGTVQEVDLVA